MHDYLITALIAERHAQLRRDAEIAGLASRAAADHRQTRTAGTRASRWLPTFRWRRRPATLIRPHPAG